MLFGIPITQNRRLSTATDNFFLEVNNLSTITHYPEQRIRCSKSESNDVVGVIIPVLADKIIQLGLFMILHSPQSSHPFFGFRNRKNKEASAPTNNRMAIISCILR